MRDMLANVDWWIWAAAAALAIAAGAGIVLALKSRGRVPEPDDMMTHGDLETFASELPRDALIVPTDDPARILVVAEGGRQSLEIGNRAGKALGFVQPQLVRRAGQLAPQALEGVLGAGTAAGRIVLVNKEFANAMKAGNVMRDSAGRIIPAVMKNGKISSLARVKAVANPATLTSLTGAASAMAMQAQLEAIEKAIAEVGAQVEDLHEDFTIEIDAARESAAHQIETVYAIAQRAGSLSQANWARVSASAFDFHKLYAGDRLRFEKSVRQLEALGPTRSGEQAKKTTDAVQEVVRSHKLLLESARTWVQFEVLQLWWMQVTDDPSLEAARTVVRLELEHMARQVEFRAKAVGALDAIAHEDWRDKTLGYLPTRKLRKLLPDARTSLSRVPWDAIAASDPSLLRAGKQLPGA